ncbi:MAG TPA: cysteate synthase, partial [Bacteroidales bacterium]|nr:cysteate synthase [Bacteroidales bacterium]
MVERFAPTEYALQSLATGALFPDAGWTLDAPGEQQPALVRAVYAKTQLELKDESWGIFRYADWLPVQRMLQGSGFPVTYRSEALAAELGLESLWITFSGWWPERGARMKSGSFKETEAYAVCGRLSAEENRVLVVASAGNTAR